MHTATNKGRVPKKFLPTSMSGTQLSCFFGPNFGPNWQMRQKCQAAMLSKAKLLQLKLIQIFARDILLMEKWEIEKTKPTFIISVLNVEY